jgi:hypothetical protein
VLCLYICLDCQWDWTTFLSYDSTQPYRVAEGDERSRYDGLQKRAHGVAMAFVTLLHPVPGGVGILSIVTALSTTITKDEDAKKRTPQKMD